MFSESHSINKWSFLIDTKGLKHHVPWGRRLYSNSNIKRPDYSLQIHSGTKLLSKESPLSQRKLLSKVQDNFFVLCFGQKNCQVKIELLDNNNRRYYVITNIWKTGKVVNLRTPLLLWSTNRAASCGVATGGTGAHHKVDGIMREECGCM